MNDISKIGNVTNAVPTAKAEGPQHTKLKKATQDFEAVFLGQMLKQIRKSMSGGNALFGNSNEAKMFQEMADEQTATQMSKTGAFGLAKTLYVSMARMLPDEDTSPTEDASTPPVTPSIGAVTAPSANPLTLMGKATAAISTPAVTANTLHAPIRNAAAVPARFARKESETR